jgi:hypothetical protein
MTAALGEAPDSEGAVALAAEFETLRRLVDADCVVLLCLRSGLSSGTALNAMTLAFPKPLYAGGDGYPNTANGSPNRSEQIAEAVDLDGDGYGIVHRSSPTPRTSGDGFASYVQLVRFIPGTKRGAILTVMSTESGVQSALAEEAETIAASFSLETAARE